MWTVRYAASSGCAGSGSVGEAIDFPGSEEDEGLAAGCGHCGDPYFLLIVSETPYLRCGNCGAIPEAATWVYTGGE